MPGPLEGIRVLDLTRGIAGPHATKLLADYGADVIKVEPPEGDPARHWGPFKGDVPHPETSAPFLWLNSNKRSVVADLATAGGCGLVRELLTGADAVVEDFAPGELARLGLDLAAARAERPALVACSITPFGQTGPYAGYLGTDIVLQAMGGAMHATGHPAREPLRLGGTFAEWHAGLAAAFAILLAVYRAEATGLGDHIDLAIYETQAGGKDRRQLALLGHAYAGLITRRTDTAYGICCGVRPCADGYVSLLGNGPRLPRLLRMIGRDDLLAHPALGGPDDQLPPDLVEEIETAYLAWTLRHTMRDALTIAQSHRILGGAVHSIADVLTDPVFRSRGVWETIDHPHTGPLDYPSRPFIMSESPRPPARRAPLLGEHTAESSGHWAVGGRALTRPFGPPSPARAGEGLRDLATVAATRLRTPDSETETLRSARRPSGTTPLPQAGEGAERSEAGEGHPSWPAARGPLPLLGIRVIDLTVVWAGPYASQQLAEWGAEVIRMEPISAIQPQTRHADRARFLTRESVARAVEAGSLSMAYVNRDPGADPWNRCTLFNSSSSNKLSFTGNPMKAGGRESFDRLVAIADVVIENNVPSTAEKMGVDYARLRAINPGIIVVRMPGFGLSGGYADYRCWGNHLEAMAGHHIVRSYPEMTLDAAGETYACDSVAGLTAAVATVMALRHRARTGRGQLVEVPQVEAFLQMMGVELLDCTMNGRVAGPMGNDHRSHAPHGAYPCKPLPLAPSPKGEGGPSEVGAHDSGADLSHDITGGVGPHEHPAGPLPSPKGEGSGERFIAIDVGTEAQWEALCRVLGAEALREDERFLDVAARWRNRRALDGEMARFTATWERMALFHALQAAGVPAGPVQNDADCCRCPHLEARGFFQEQTRADIGTFRYPGMIFRWADTPNHHRRPPVTLGQDNAYVYLDLLGLPARDYQSLIDAGEVGTTYSDAVLGR